MKTPSTPAIAILVLLLALLVPGRAVQAAAIRIVTSRAMATALEGGLGAEFEEATGHKLRIVTGFSPEFVKRIHAGEAFDIVIAPAPVIDGLAASGRVVPDTRTPLVRSKVGVAVRAGAPKPDLSSVQAFKQALRNAKSVGYLPTAGVPQLMERLGMVQAVKPEAVVPATDTVCEQVARGEVELGVVIVTQILTTPGVELAGPIPPEIQFWTVFAAAVLENAPESAAARELLKFLVGSKAHPVITMQGMEPA